MRQPRLRPLEDLAVELLGGLRVAGSCGAKRELDARECGGPERPRGLGGRECLSASSSAARTSPSVNASDA